MKVLVTGSEGFIGKNLVSALRDVSGHEALGYDVGSSPDELYSFTRECGFVFHLAGVNRPREEKEYMEQNAAFTARLLELLRKNENFCPVLLSSSIQAELDNPYGRSKKAAEELVFSHGQKTGAKVLVYRLPNVFGKWCRPGYNSAVATFCHSAASGLPLEVADSGRLLRLAYIDDVVDEFLRALDGRENREGDFCRVPVESEITLGEIADMLRAFERAARTNAVPELRPGSFESKLYGTFVSYLPQKALRRPLEARSDGRGVFAEFVRTASCGQFSVCVTKPGRSRGGHYHRVKSEKFLAAAGRGRIELRRADGGEVTAFDVSGDKLEVIEVPPGYVHRLVNTGDADLVTLIWASEAFDPESPDTWRAAV